ncbi:GlsB/YeaQ/YmgE family stress response membrane protein [Xylophilus rhododendri]|uniref:GlsB/YeaQ/YmgE family stress response membrane protein n=1 Tax=Xylophilus rhododendri TaxID=2697032 RepID=A0A857J186_9BURK|nr:GlsB/YeaQ/YmgE family stress response membrane protein [Xylophilus rhododendri]QHI96728.1 GlsB/YeaQ/YmgE family stress response membrane protein [Xylophilus rhododendri]
MTIGLFWTIFAGVIAGILMNGFVPLRRLTGMKGLLALCGVGVVGALAASFGGQAMQLWGREEIGAFVAAVVGACCLLAVLAYATRLSPAVPAAAAA